MGRLWRSQMQVHLRLQRIRHRLYGKSTQQIFQTIYLNNLWRNPETRSGWGSTVAGRNGTERVRDALTILFGQFEITSILDAPCGDFNWMKLVDLTGKVYTGIDIVPEVIARNQLLFGNHARRFMVADLTQDPLPCADLAIVRDVLIHLTNAQIVAAIKNVYRSGTRYLLVSNYSAVKRNGDTFVGGLRLYNIYDAPFSVELQLPPPVLTFRDGDGNEGRQMALIDLAAIRLSKMAAEPIAMPGGATRS